MRRPKEITRILKQIFSLVLELNGKHGNDGEPPRHLFLTYYGHTDSISLEYCADGWHGERPANEIYTYRRVIYFDTEGTTGKNYERQLKKALDQLAELKELLEAIKNGDNETYSRIIKAAQEKEAEERAIIAELKAKEEKDA